MSPVEMLDVLYSQQGLMNVDGKATTTPAAVTSALNNALTVPLSSPDYPTALQNAVATAVAGRAHPHLALHQPAHLRLQPHGQRHTVGPGAAALGRRHGGQLTRWQSSI